MKVQQVGRRVHLELHPMELTALVTAARWVVDGAEGELPSAAVDQLRQVLALYDEQLARRSSPAHSGDSGV